MAAGFVALALLAPTHAPPTSSGPDYGARPGHFGTEGMPEGRFEHALEAGTEVADAVEIFNFTPEPTWFAVYAADMVATTGGGWAPAGPDVESAAAGTWIVPEVERVQVGPRSSTLVPFRIAVPYGTVPGDEVAALLVEPELASGIATVRNRARISLPVVIEVLGSIDLGVSVGDMTWGRDPAGIRFSVPVTNTGTVTFLVGGAVHLGSWRRVSPSELTLGPPGRYVAPGVTVQLEGLWEGPPWFGHVVAQPVVDATVGERAPRRFEGRVIDLWLVPWGMVWSAAGITVALAALLWFTRGPRRRRRDRRREEREMLREYRANRRAPREGPPRTPQPVGSGGRSTWTARSPT